MVKAFSEQEKRFIREKLLKKGRELLSVYGLRKTSIEDVTKAVGISKGAFYTFFPSKEEFFFEIFELLEQEIKNELSGAILQEGKGPKESFREFLHRIFDMMDRTPLLQIMNPEDMQYLMRGLPPERIEEHMRKDNDFTGLFLQSGIGNQLAQGIDAEVLSGFFRAIVFMHMSKKEIGEKVYPQVQDLMIDMMVHYFVK